MLMRMVRKLVFSRVGFLAAGAGAMYFFDPERGSSRRAQGTSQLQGLARRQAQGVVGQVTERRKEAQNLIRHTVADKTGKGRYHPESDVDLREHLRQVIRSLPIRGEDVTVDVAEGRVSLRGQVDSTEDRSRICDAVDRVDGVVSVEDFTHLPGETAPNKAAAIRASQV